MDNVYAGAFGYADGLIEMSTMCENFANRHSV